MIRRLSMLVAPILTIVASAACSQAPGTSSGSMTLQRFLERQTERVMAADTDGDGRVSRAEMATLTTNGGRDPSQRFDAMDANHDGYLDKAEIQATLTRRFRRMDSNGDGVVTPDERMAARAKRGQRAPTDGAATPQP